MARIRLLLIASAVAAVVVPSHGQGSPPQAGIIGTWLLESIVDTLPNGSLSYWMGEHPTGAIVYSASGHVSVQFMRDPRPSLPPRAASGADPASLAGATTGCVTTLCETVPTLSL